MNIDAQNSSIYYGIYIPPDSLKNDDNAQVIHVYTDKLEALEILKTFKKARFKVFKSYQDAEDFTRKGSECVNSSIDHDMNLISAEKPSLFKGPKTQDMIKLKKLIESGDIESIKKLVWDNPRYLVSSGDTPAILQEGCRYNALHIATKAMNAGICEFILTTVTDPDFSQLLYGDDSLISCQDRAKMLLDLYLNTPDKGLNETPLHFAVKYGAAACVELLTSYRQCDKNCKNKFGQVPKEMVCQRQNNADSSVKNEILKMLDDRFFVPVLRSEDNSIQPRVGEPFSPNSPPSFNNDPISPRIEIRAYAGPMKKEEAILFRKKWKTPPRLMTQSIRRPDSLDVSHNTPNKSLTHRFIDPEKGLERVGRDLAHQYCVAWKEYWPFLDTFIDLTSKDGLDLFEKYLNDRLKQAVNKVYSNLTFTDKCVPKSPRKTIPSVEDDIRSVLSPISELCQAFKACSINSDVSNEFETVDNQSDLNPFLCMEKSLQVIATRVFQTMTNVSVNLTNLKSEVKHLNILIGSYMTDLRFSQVDFQCIHSRVAFSINQHLKNKFLPNEHAVIYQSCLSIINNINENESKKQANDSVIIDHHVECIVRKILGFLEKKMPEISEIILTEEQCRNVWNKMEKCSCSWQTQTWKRNTRKVASFKRDLANKFKGFLGLQKLDLKAVRNSEGDLGDVYSDSSDEEIFLTPPTSPTKSVISSDSDDERNMMDVSDQNPVDVYIEADIPTKIDSAVYDVLQNTDISPNEYPNVYYWRHSIKLYSEDEREKWLSPTVVRLHNRPTPITSTPKTKHYNNNDSPDTPQIWTRVTGFNSPRNSVTARRLDLM